MTLYLCHLLQFLILYPAAILCFLPMKNQLAQNKMKALILTFCVLTIYIPIGAWLVNYTSISSNLVLFPSLILFFATYCKMVKSNFGECLAIFLQSVTLLSYPADYALGVDAAIHPDETLFDVCLDCSVTQLIFSLIFVLVFGIFSRHFQSVLIDNLKGSRVWYVFLPVPLIFLLLNILIQPHQYATLYTGRLFFLYIMFLSLSLFLFVLTYIIFYFVANELLVHYKTQERIRLLEMQEHQYVTQQTYMDESRRIRHDFRQSLYALSQLAESGDIETIQQYLRNYASAIPKNEITTYCKNVSVNALLNYYADLMTENNIYMKWNIELPDKLTISDIDLCSMLGNMLENILHGCMTVSSSKRYCNLSILLRHNTNLYIVASNSFDGNVKQKGDTYHTSHKGGHGIGLSSIAITAERYGGVAKFSHNGTEFYTDIVLRQ